MKKILIASAFILSCINISAQPPQSGRNRHEVGRPHMESERPKGSSDNTTIGIMKIPDIPELTINQREKLSKTLTDEQKTISKLMDEKHELMERSRDSTEKSSEKEIEKQMKKIVKIDEKIEKAKSKSDKKIRSILTTEQYQFFSKKRDEVEFKRDRKMGDRPPMRNRRQPPMPPNEQVSSGISSGI